MLPSEKPDPRSPPSPSDYALLWDVEGFAERLNETLDDQTLPEPITETLINNDSTPQPIRVDLKAPGRERLARYMRFQVIAHKRYASAYRAAAYALRVDARKARWYRKGGTAEGEEWSTDRFGVLRPAAVPALDAPAELPPPVVPRPGIRAMIPLTRAIRAGEGPRDPVAGVLAIADGGWFEHAGLAEWMLRGWRSRNGARVSRLSWARIPLVRNYGLGGSPQDLVPKAFIEMVPLELAGPQGHSFDTGTATGLYLNSSIVVRAPKLVQDGPLKDPAGWWMGKLAFRRLPERVN